MKLMTKLLKNKFIMICLSLLMCLTLMFSVVAKPLEAHAVAGIDDAIYYVLVTVCSSLMINLAVDNPDTGAEIARLWEGLSAGAQHAVQEAAYYVVTGSYSVYEWEVNTFQSLANEVREWFGLNHVDSTEIAKIIPTNPDNYIGFTNDSSFSLYYPNADTAIYILPSASMYIIDKIYTSNIDYYVFNDNTEVGFIMIKCNNGLAYLRYIYRFYLSSPKNSNFTSRLIPTNGTYEIYNPTNYFVSFQPNQTVYQASNGSYYYDYVNNIPYEFAYDSASSSYVLRSPVNGTIYNNFHFADKITFADWFCNACGFVVNRYINDPVDNNASPVDIPRPAVDFDATRSQQAQDVIDAIDTETIATTLPGSLDQAQTISDNPAKVWDVAAEGTYTGNIQLPDLQSMEWYDKFPFCIPFDVVRLFTSFQAPAEAPNFHILILPANSFGFQNDDIYWDIDFSDYHILVQILRFFLSVLFVFWLIMVTRKLIGAS